MNPVIPPLLKRILDASDEAKDVVREHLGNYVSSSLQTCPICGHHPLNHYEHGHETVADSKYPNPNHFNPIMWIEQSCEACESSWRVVFRAAYMENAIVYGEVIDT